MYPFNNNRKSVATECTQCGDRLFLPERSEYVDEHRARYLWQCESCGYNFETTLRFAGEAA
jgi:uncharacterized Zn finger protein